MLLKFLLIEDLAIKEGGLSKCALPKHVRHSLVNQFSLSNLNAICWANLEQIQHENQFVSFDLFAIPMSDKFHRPFIQRLSCI